MSRTDVLAWLSSLTAHALAGAVLLSYQSAQVTVVRGRAPGALPTPAGSIDTRTAEEPKPRVDTTLRPVHVDAAELARTKPMTVPGETAPSPLPRAAQPGSPMLAARPVVDEVVERPRQPRSVPAAPPHVPEPNQAFRRIAAELPEPPKEARASPEEDPRRVEPRPRAEASLLAQLDPGEPTPRRDTLPSNQPPAYEHNPPPPYPPEAVRRRLEGRVLLTVQVRADGTVERVAVAQSSGYALLDRAALAAVRKWRFQPARRFGSPVPAAVRVPVRFRLEE